ncbi:TIR domain-containing protein [Ktedonobacteria bacterium brp13]|nr:TIR domain-containing protein [Ktedonobacteria bacterium brp13]
MSNWDDWADWNDQPMRGDWHKISDIQQDIISKDEDSKTYLTLYYIYAREDALLQSQLEKHLSLLQRWDLISNWYSREIVAGTKWDTQFDMHLEEASIILLLISSDFLASDYSYNTEIQRTLERHRQGKARVVPIILRPCDWRATPFAYLQPLPRNARAVTTWDSLDAAFADITRSIRLICRELQQLSATYILQSSHKPSQTYQFDKVFVKSGTPTVTFVEPIDFEALKQSLAQPGRGVVIEGPSGVGKTTAVEKAIEFLADLEKNFNLLSANKRRPSRKKFIALSARNPDHRRRLQTLRQWHKGTVIVDDFHRLDPVLREDLIDYLKYLADTNSTSRKLVIVGIPRTGQTLVDTSFDLSTRIDVFPFGHVSDEIMFQMVGKGELALNILFDRKADIIIAANGSLNIAQFLCFNLCQIAKIVETCDQSQIVPYDFDTAQSSVIKDLSRKFGESVRRFAAMGGPRDSTSLLLLEELINSEDGFVSVPSFKNKRPEIAQFLERFITEGWMERLYHEYPECEQHFFFDHTKQILVIDDPQLAFYLKQLRISMLARDAGKIAKLTQRKVFISYSHENDEWLKRLRVHLKLIEREGIIDLWDETKIAAGMQWRGAILEAMRTSKVAVLLISAEFLASDFIVEHELPTLLTQAASGGTIILPVIVSPCLFHRTKLSNFKPINPPDKPLSLLSKPKQDQILVGVAETIMQHLTNIEIKKKGNTERTQ